MEVTNHGKKTLTEFVINHIESDEHLSQLKEINPMVVLGFMIFGINILQAYQKALIEGIEFTVEMEDD